MDPQQHQGIRVRHPTKGIEDGRGICWQFHSYPGDVQASSRSMARCFYLLDRIGPGNRLCSRYRLNKSMNVNCFIDQLSSGILHCHVPPQGRIVTRVFEDMILGDATLLCEGIFCIFVPLRGLLALVHRWGYGWDGVYWGRVQHEWFGLWVPAVPRCYCWRGGWIRRGGGRIWRMNQDMKKVSLGTLGSSALPASTLQTIEKQKGLQSQWVKISWP